eukprot:12584771-Alexandrium_andersonii.AAC.1
MHRARASGTNLQAVPGPVQFQVRAPGAVRAFSISAGAGRFDRFDPLLGAIDTRCKYVPSSTSLAR